MKRHKLFLLLLLTPMFSWAQVCGDLHAKPSIISTSVTLQPKPGSPAFYYREGVDYVIFISEQSIMQALAERERVGDLQIKRLAPLIRAQLPIKEDRDLYYFNLSDWLFYDTIRRLVAFSIERGDAAIVTSSVSWLTTATVVHRRRAKIADTTIYGDIEHRSRIITLIDCIVD